MADAQSGHEKTITSLLPALAGANLIYGLGMLESGVTIDYAQLVMDAEFARMVKYCVPGITVTDETLSVDVIAEVGPVQRLPLARGHLQGHARPVAAKLIDRRVREDWTAAGSTSIYDRALVEARHILETHVPEPLPDGVADELRAIIAGAEEELGVGG